MQTQLIHLSSDLVLFSLSAVTLHRDAPGDGREETIPNEADFLLSYATLPGYVSYRSSTHGSWYITKLVEMLDIHANRCVT